MSLNMHENPPWFMSETGSTCGLTAGVATSPSTPSPMSVSLSRDEDVEPAAHTTQGERKHSKSPGKTNGFSSLWRGFLERFISLGLEECFLVRLFRLFLCVSLSETASSSPTACAILSLLSSSSGPTTVGVAPTLCEPLGMLLTGLSRSCNKTITGFFSCSFTLHSVLCTYIRSAFSFCCKHGVHAPYLCLLQ